MFVDANSYGLAKTMVFHGGTSLSWLLIFWTSLYMAYCLLSKELFASTMRLCVQKEKNQEIRVIWGLEKYHIVQ